MRRATGAERTSSQKPTAATLTPLRPMRPQGRESIPAHKEWHPHVVTVTMLNPPPRGVGVLCSCAGFGRSTSWLIREWRSSHTVKV